MHIKIRTVSVVLATLASIIPVFGASADQSRSRRHGFVRLHTKLSADSVELGALAPPSSRSTYAQVYGDAAIARNHFQRGEHFQRGAETMAVPGPYPCDPRLADAQGYVCANRSDRVGYGQYYAFTPAYVSSPQIVGVDPDLQTPLLSPVTSFFWAVNSARIDPHN